MLKKNFCGGTNTSILYEALCEAYGFDKSKVDNFGHQGALLYANDVTKEHYSVWCLTNTNWHKKKNSDKCNWYNEISGDKENCEIIEHWNKELWQKYDVKSTEFTTTLYGLKDTRLTFVKCKDGKYYFLGVYKFVEKNDVEKIKKYVLISDAYPVK